jgi:hypothetical protein
MITDVALDLVKKNEGAEDGWYEGGF